MNPLISVILPTYNWTKQRLSEAIESVLSQTYPFFELLIINDASTNGIEKTIQSYAKKDKRVIYIYNQANLKLTKTLNKGIELAKWTYIARIDDDDTWCDTDKLKQQVEFMENNPDYAVIGTRGIHIFDESSEHRNLPLTDQEIRQIILFNTPFHHSSVLIRKEALDTIGNYNPSYNGIEDRELRLRLWTRYKLANIASHATTYRHSSTSSITAKQQSFLARLKVNRSIFLLSWKYRKNYPKFLKSVAFRIFSCSPLLLQRSIVAIVKSNKRLQSVFWV